MPEIRYPPAIDPEKVGTYDALAKSGGGYFYDEVLEYRVWCHPEKGAPDEENGDNYFYAFAEYADALAFSEATPGSEGPLALVLQREHLNEPTPGVYVHVKDERITEWSVEWLEGSKRSSSSIPEFLANMDQFTKKR